MTQKTGPNEWRFERDWGPSLPEVGHGGAGEPVEESRREYDKKVETMEEIDDKAMRSVRTAVIVVGLVVSAVSVSSPGAVGDLSLWPVLVAAFGIGTLTVSIAVGIGVYTATRYSSGIGSPHRFDVIEGTYGYDEWLVEMLRQHDE